MRKLVFCSLLILFLAAFGNAQPKSIVGKVIDYSVGNRGTWAGITIKVGPKTFFIYLEQIDLETPKIIGKVDEVGRTVKVFYSTIVSSPDCDGELRATRIVEVRSAAKRSRR